MWKQISMNFVVNNFSMMKIFSPFKWLKMTPEMIHQDISVWSKFSRIKSNFAKGWEFLLSFFHKFI